VKSTNFVLAGMILVGISGTIPAALAEAGAQKKNLKKDPIPSSKSEAGAQLYRNYCAACHGLEGKGDGQVAKFLKAPPADLSTLARRNNGRYPADSVAATLSSGTDSGVHGTSDMPIWGQAFKSRGKDVAQMRIRKLTEFIESLQQK
jgi:mono/diheme cytochrome c family protein